MSKINADIKTTQTGAGEHDKSFTGDGAKLKAASIGTDSYSNTEKTEYEKLVDGTVKNNNFHRGIQGTLNGLISCFGSPTEADHEMPAVPTIEEIFELSPTIHENMGAVIERYEGVKRVLIAEIANQKNLIAGSQKGQATIGDVLDAQNQIEELTKQLTLCNNEIRRSYEYKEWHESNVKAQENS